MLQKLAASNVGALLVVVFILVRIYSGWSYVGARLKSPVIEYEETGWYDGDVETKTPSEQLRDELLYEDKVEPVVERLKLFTLGAGALWLASCIGYNAVLSAKPVFDEYNPAMLEKLQYDERLAGVAAQQSSGRPTYCDNRYVSHHLIAGDTLGLCLVLSHVLLLSCCSSIEQLQMAVKVSKCQWWQCQWREKGLSISFPLLITGCN